MFYYYYKFKLIFRKIKFELNTLIVSSQIPYRLNLYAYNWINYININVRNIFYINKPCIEFEKESLEKNIEMRNLNL